ncbi:hypothetical protein PSAC2689_170003 [Paraburkholderia sacchari]
MTLIAGRLLQQVSWQPQQYDAFAGAERRLRAIDTGRAVSTRSTSHIAQETRDEPV